ARALLPDILAALEADRSSEVRRDPRAANVSAAGRSADSLRAALDALSPEQLEPRLVSVLAEEVSQSLPFPDRNGVDLDVPLNALGMDSLTAVQLRMTLQQKLELPLSTHLGLDSAVTSVRSLAAQLLPMFGAQSSVHAGALDFAEEAALGPEIQPVPGILRSAP